MSNNVITIRKETAQSFLPADMHRHGAIDLQKLSRLAKDAIEGSDASLAAAGAIADGSWWDRFFNSGAMQRHVIQSITHIRDLSKVNLGLSAICNDLAAANLEHASRIDQNHHEINQKLNQVQQLTGELLTHLRKPREPALLDRLLPALAKANPADQDAMRGWLRTVTEEIDLQYVVLQENLDKLSQQNDNTMESVTWFRAEIALLSVALTNQKADAVQQLGLLSSRLSAGQADLEQKVDKSFVAIRQSHDALSAAVENQVKLLRADFQNDLTQAKDRILSIEAATKVADSELERKISALTREMTKRQSEIAIAMRVERDTREVMQKALLKFIKEREDSIRTTIGDLNRHLLQRMIWVASGIAVFQILGFGFLAFKMGVFK